MWVTNPKKFPGRLIVVEGPDGSGKSTAAKLIVSLLLELEPGKTVTTSRLPNGDVRKMVLNRTEPIPPKAEALLLPAGHLIELHNVIEPALSKGHFVVLDRYFISTLTYQGYGRNQVELVEQTLRLYFHDEVRPDVTFFILAGDDLCAERLSQRANKDDFDAETRDFHKLIQSSSRQIADRCMAQDPFNTFVIDNSGTTEQLEQTLRRMLVRWLREDQQRAERDECPQTVMLGGPSGVDSLALYEAMMRGEFAQSWITRAGGCTPNEFEQLRVLDLASLNEPHVGIYASSDRKQTLTVFRHSPCLAFAVGSVGGMYRKEQQVDGSWTPWTPWEDHEVYSLDLEQKRIDEMMRGSYFYVTKN